MAGLLADNPSRIDPTLLDVLPQALESVPFRYIGRAENMTEPTRSSRIDSLAGGSPSGNRRRLIYRIRLRVRSEHGLPTLPY